MDHSHEPFTMLGASCRMTGSYFRDPQQNFPFLDGFRTMFGRAAYGLHQGISHMLIKSLYLLLKSHLCVHKDPFFWALQFSDTFDFIHLTPHVLPFLRWPGKKLSFRTVDTVASIGRAPQMEDLKQEKCGCNQSIQSIFGNITSTMRSSPPTNTFHQTFHQTKALINKTGPLTHATCRLSMFDLQVLQPQELKPSRAFPFSSESRKRRWNFLKPKVRTWESRGFCVQRKSWQSWSTQQKQLGVPLPQAQATLTLKSGKTFMRQPLTCVVDGNEFVGLSIWLCLKMEDIPKWPIIEWGRWRLTNGWNGHRISRQTHMGFCSLCVGGCLLPADWVLTIVECQLTASNSSMFFTVCWPWKWTEYCSQYVDARLLHYSIFQPLF